MRLVLLALMCFACGSASGLPSGKYIHANTSLPVVPGTTLEVRFDVKLNWTRLENLGTFAVWDGCNTITGAFLLVDGIMTRPAGQFEPITRTLMGCEPYHETERQERAAIDFFASGPAMSYDGETVTLDNGEVTLVLVKP